MRIRFLRRTLIGVALIPLVITGTVVSANGEAASRVRSFSGTLLVALPTSGAPQMYPLYMAESDGIYAKYGLSVNVQIITGPALTAGLESGDINYAMIGAPMLDLAQQEGVPVQLIAEGGEHSQEYLTAKPDIASLQDAVGHAYAYSTPTSFSTILTEYALHTVGLKINQLKLVSTSAANNPAPEFAAGLFDIFNGTASQVRAAEALVPGTKILYNFSRLAWPDADIWGYKPFMTTHRAETIAFLRAINAAFVKWNSDPSVAEQWISKELLTTSPTTLAADYSSTEAILNHGKEVLHVPTYKIQSFVDRTLRLVGFATATNNYAREGQSWTSSYWNAAFGKA